jgi:nickel transport protein
MYSRAAAGSLCFRPIALSLVLLAAAGTVRAHDLWLEKEGAGLVLRQGHKYSAHAGAQSIPYEPGFVTGALCVDAAGAARTLAPAKVAPWKLAMDCDAVRVSVSSGYWTKTVWETKNLPKNQVPGAIKSWLSVESVKRVERWSGAAAQAGGDGLEITPLADPLTLKPEDKLTVRVSDDGKAKSGVAVAYGGDVRGATGPDGTIAIRLRHGGVNLVTASVETALADGKADLRIETATLQFDLPQ